MGRFRLRVRLRSHDFCALIADHCWVASSLDLYFWYGSAFGSPTARVQGLGYVQELVARLTHTPIET